MNKVRTLNYKVLKTLLKPAPRVLHQAAPLDWKPQPNVIKVESDMTWNPVENRYHTAQVLLRSDVYSIYKARVSWRFGAERVPPPHIAKYGVYGSFQAELQSLYEAAIFLRDNVYKEVSIADYPYVWMQTDKEGLDLMLQACYDEVVDERGFLDSGKSKVVEPLRF